MPAGRSIARSIYRSGKISYDEFGFRLAEGIKHGAALADLTISLHRSTKRAHHQQTCGIRKTKTVPCKRHTCFSATTQAAQHATP